MEINFLELLQFAQENGNNPIYDKFIGEVLKLLENPDLVIDINIPEEILKQYLLLKF